MKEYTTDLLIIGGGAAGMAAATAASECGVKVLLAEANAAVGGNGLFPRGIFGVDSDVQRRNLVFADRDQVFQDCMKDAHWKLDGRIVRALIDKSGDTISWLEDLGVEFLGVVHHIPNQAPEVFHITDPKENTGRVVIRALKNACEKNGVQILTSTRGKSLLLDENGKVCGAICTQKDVKAHKDAGAQSGDFGKGAIETDAYDGQGEEITIHAKKVIVCCGGFAGNKEMIHKFYPDFKSDEIPAGGGMRHPGDGVRMAMEAGADIEGHFTMEIAAPKIQGYGPLNLILGKATNVWLNKFGRRFADEGIVYNFAMAANAVMRQPDTKVWVVFTREMIDDILKEGRDMIEMIHIPFGAEDELEQTIKDACRDGIMVEADSPARLAAFIGCNADNVEAAIDEYNGFCFANSDRTFAKDPRYLLPMLEGPYYAVRAGADMLITHGGIRVNENFEALKSDYLPLGNLYMAGVDFGGADADVYNVEMSGHGFGFAVNSGRIAGEHAARTIRENN